MTAPTRSARTANSKRGRRAGIYARISKWDGEGVSLGVQRQVRDCRREAERRRWTVVEVYTDDDKSAFSGKTRPGYVRLCDDLKAGAIDAVVVWDVDRLHRLPRELEDFVTLIEATGAVVASVSGGEYDLETADGRFKARIMGAVSRKESEDKSRRLRRKHVELAEAGRPNGGRRPLGYRRVDGQFVVDPDEAPIVREVIERIGAGETLTRVADDLNDRGVPTSTGARWTIWTVKRVSVNGLYAGRRIHKGADVGEGSWPAIVDEATWRRAVALLNAPDRPQRRSSRRYLLVGGIVRCANCGGPMRSKPHHTRSGTVRTYACPVERQGGCGGTSIRADQLEQLVAAAVVDRVESRAFAKALRARSGGDRKAAVEVNRLTAELKELEEAKGSGALSLREYLRFRDATNERLASAQARMAGDTRESAVGRFAAQAGALRKWWDDPTTTLDQRQAVVRAVIERIVVSPVKRRGGRAFDESRVKVIPAR